VGGSPWFWRGFLKPPSFLSWVPSKGGNWGGLGEFFPFFPPLFEGFPFTGERSFSLILRWGNFFGPLCFPGFFKGRAQILLKSPQASSFCVLSGDSIRGGSSSLVSPGLMGGLSLVVDPFLKFGAPGLFFFFGAPFFPGGSPPDSPCFSPRGGGSRVYPFWGGVSHRFLRQRGAPRGGYIKGRRGRAG